MKSADRTIASLMQLRWTAEAADDLERIADSLLTHAPGRASEKEGTRELVLSPLPYIVVYTVRADTGAQEPRKH